METKRPAPLAYDGSEPPVGTPEATDARVRGVGLNQPTDDRQLAVDPGEPTAEEPPSEAPRPLAIRDMAPEPPKRRTSPRFKLPKG